LSTFAERDRYETALKTQSKQFETVMAEQRVEYEATIDKQASEYHVLNAKASQDTQLLDEFTKTKAGRKLRASVVSRGRSIPK
jgi:hypothetical protein